MARRTKEEAEKTRTAILDAAEQVFMEAGVARSSLHQIAMLAGVTRGAVYWHFRDKLAIVHAMADRVILPEEAFLDEVIAKETATPIDDLHQMCFGALSRVLNDPGHRRVLTILSTRCEYIDEMSFITKRQAECMERFLARFTRIFEKARKLGQLAQDWTPGSASYALHCFFHGIVSTDIKSGGLAETRKLAVPALNGFFSGLKG